ncbi:MAG: hypothetical protein ACW98U_01910 [Candidatus Thorarchaeota archaeon]|jgi:DNA-directed RNA polymerase subunit H (RpoH/RPB5)
MSVIMSRLEEESTKRHVVVDRFEARWNHFKTLSFSTLLSFVYAAYLWVVCSTRPDVTSALLLFGSQIAIGFPATRAYYEWGISNKEKLTFLDPAKLNRKGRHLEVDIHLGDLSLFFEKMDLEIQRYDKGSHDDLNDMAWFGILVWAAVSSTIFFLAISSYPLCIVGSLVLMMACLGGYLSGYWKSRPNSFEDELSHLQYYVERRYKELYEHLPKNGARIYLQLIEQRKSVALMEFSIEVQLGGQNVLEFHMGLSSTEQERIVIKAEDDVLRKILNEAEQIPDIENNDWMTERIMTSSGPIVRILNQSSEFSILNRSSFVRSPSLIDDSSKNVGDIFSRVLRVAV